MNAFDKSLENTFRNREVQLISNKGRPYRGFVDRINYRDRHVVLHGAENLDTGEHVGSVMVAHADVMELVNEERRIERLSIEEIAPSPYAAAEFHREQNLGYIEQVRSKGVLGTFPVVRPTAEGTDAPYEVVEGHKRLWVLREAGIGAHAFEVSDVSEWDAARSFVEDHIPTARHVREDGSTDNEWYTNEEIKSAIETLLSRWGDQALELPEVAYNADRLDLATGAT